MKNRSISLSITIVILVLLSISCRMCNEESKPKIFDPARFNPYKESLEALVGNKVGAFKRNASKKIDYPGAVDAVEATYEQQLGNFVSIQPDTLKVRVTNFATTAEAENEIQKAAVELQNKTKNPHLKVSEFRPNTMKGVTIGKFIEAQTPYDDRANYAERVYWTNGSLFCVADSKLYSDSALHFQENAPF